MTERGNHLSSVILKLTSRCNLRCTYCYLYEHEDRSFAATPARIGDDVFDATLDRMRDYCDRRGSARLSLVLHGGEPTLLGPARFAQLAARARDRLGPRLRRISVQTNATRIDARWARLLKEHDIGVGVSVDGPREVNDLVRVDHAGRGTYDRTMAGIGHLRDAGIPVEVLCVVNPGQSGADVYRHLRAEGVRWINFLLPDVSHDNKDHLYGAHGPTPVADYLIPAFDAWYAEDDPTVVVAVFWELLRRMLGGTGLTDTFGNPRMSYLIVGTDGEIEALDALRVCGEGISQSALNVRTHSFDDLRQGNPLVHRAVHEGFDLSETCRACAIRDTCGGGYLPHRYSRANGFDNPSVWCADILALVAHIRARALGSRAAHEVAA